MQGLPRLLTRRSIRTGPASGEMETDWMLSSGQADLAAAVHGSFDLDRRAGLQRRRSDRGRPGWSAAVDEQLVQLGGEAEPGRDRLEADTREEQQVHDGGVGPQGDLASGMHGPSQNCCPLTVMLREAGTVLTSSTARSLGAGPRTAGPVACLTIGRDGGWTSSVLVTSRGDRR
jgi:hypothetical protein